jgi:hypothetical protein
MQHFKTYNNLLMKFHQFSFTIEYKKGSEMPADFFSRNPLETINATSDDLGAEQDEDDDLRALRLYLNTGQLPTSGTHQLWVLKNAETSFMDNGILWRRLTRHNFEPRSVVYAPQSRRADIVAHAHGTVLTGHGGVAKTTERILESYYWPNIQKYEKPHTTAVDRSRCCPP